MIYVSTAKIDNILEKYNKPGVEISVDQMEVKFLGVNSKINIAKRQNNLDKVIKILKKEKLYYDVFEHFRIGCYYKIRGQMKYKDYVQGMLREDNEKLRNKDSIFLSDEKLLFDISLSEDYCLNKIEIECNVQNVKCFSDGDYGETKIFRSNTSDPGILSKSLNVESVIELRQIKQGSKSAQGSPLYIKLLRG